jgi:hypothetical protein
VIFGEMVEKFIGNGQVKRDRSQHGGTKNRKLTFMEITLPLDKMSVPEKLRLMEALWADLSRHEESIESPVWHEEVLRDREARVKSGEETFMDWETTKQQLRDRCK